MEEYFDIVDENNKLTGEIKLRKEVHNTGLWHRTVHIYLFRKVVEDIEFLVHLRSKAKDLHPNKWDTRFGGHIKSRETIEEAIENELMEEVGLKLEPANLMIGEIYKADHYPNREFTYVNYYRFDGELSTLKFNDGEVQQIKWMKSEEIINLITKQPKEWSGEIDGFVKILNTLKTKLEISGNC